MASKTHPIHGGCSYFIWHLLPSSLPITHSQTSVECHLYRKQHELPHSPP
jgi:hypothetical protein